MSVASALSNFMSSVYNFTLKSASALSSSSGKLKALIVGSDEAVEALLSDLLASDILEEAIVIGGRTIERRTISGAHDISFIEGDVTSALLRRDLNAKRFNVFLALTNKDEKNFLALALAKSRRIPIRVGLFRKREVARLIRELGLG
ncbi:MAG: NAD-binding protein, partial [Desulfurococcaceae archaeon]